MEKHSGHLKVSVVEGVSVKRGFHCNPFMVCCMARASPGCQSVMEEIAIPRVHTAKKKEHWS